MKKKSILIICGVILLTAVFCIFFGAAKYHFAPKNERYIDHQVNASADPSVGPETVPEDGRVDETFASHLPLIIIDTGGEEILNYNSYNSDTDAFEEPEGIDPYFSMTLSVIDNSDHINTLSDARSVETPGKIKVRGNSSASKSLPKFQYTVKLLDEDGDNADVDLLDMGAENSWVLTPTVRDLSYIRNYLAYNVAGQLEPYQPDIRYCEVLLKNGEQYEYMGLYMLCEPVEVSENRVDIEKDVSKYHVGQGYLINKDRFQEDAVTLYTWATEEGYYLWTEDKIDKGSYFTLEYPSREDVTQEQISEITEQISQIERLLYDDDLRNYASLDKLMDMDSFVDYFILNEFFANYDAGQYSTFMYKDADGKLTMGPYWDYDGAYDNADTTLTNPNAFAFFTRPWFDQLIKLKGFSEKVEARYKELRSTILSEDAINTFIDETLAYLGNARLRDRSFYSDYVHQVDINTEDVTDLTIDRNRYSTEDEVRRIKDFLEEHGAYMDEHIGDLKQHAQDNEAITEYNTLIGFLFIVFVIVVIVVVQRYQDLR